ncbi:hypothetical protein [Stutzerimonas tarimensis]|uniref:Uncharacterized protein n=1 Tax=Stutzerimonas tarimensis TaxID=1507735 RepID=A0ABV7T1R3_9GAMM
MTLQKQEARFILEHSFLPLESKCLDDEEGLRLVVVLDRANGRYLEKPLPSMNSRRDLLKTIFDTRRELLILVRSGQLDGVLFSDGVDTHPFTPATRQDPPQRRFG